jgi:hypothetical protein
VAVCDEAERRIRALPLPSAPDALARMIEAAEARGMEKAAAWHDEQAERVRGGPLYDIDKAAAHRSHAAALRARAKEAGDE